jgi:tRNA(Ile)-lysidine synthase
MENSRKPQSDNLVAHVAAQLREALFPGANLLLGLSGGMDSICLLHVLAELAAPHRFSLRAVHVNHGISANSDQWAGFCRNVCNRLGVPLAVENVDVSIYRHLGPEAAARAVRWAALQTHDFDFLVLAQHRDDQAETLLLQLLRGAGPAGLAGMAANAFHPSTQPTGDSRSAPRQTRVLRPLLQMERADVEQFVRERGLEWVEDESNANVMLERNFLRHQVIPVLSARYPHATAMIARSAGLLSESSALLDQLGRQDIALIEKDEGLDLPGLRLLGEARARNALRSYCNLREIPVPGYSRLHEIWQQLREPRPDSRICISWDGFVLRRYRNRVFIEKYRDEPASAFDLVAWDGEPSLALTALNGMLNFKPEEGRGISVAKLRSAPVTIRLRRGGERLRIDPRRPHRTLKNLWQEKGTPPWRRERLPLLFCGEQLVCVPGLGEEFDWRAGPGERGLIVSWQAF